MKVYHLHLVVILATRESKKATVVFIFAQSCSNLLNFQLTRFTHDSGYISLPLSLSICIYIYVMFIVYVITYIYIYYIIIFTYYIILLLLSCGIDSGGPNSSRRDLQQVQQTPVGLSTFSPFHIYTCISYYKCVYII